MANPLRVSLLSTARLGERLRKALLLLCLNLKTLGELSTEDANRELTTSSNTNRLRNEATALRNSLEFSRKPLMELASTDFKSWAKESFQIAVKIAYQNGAIRGTPKGDRRECSELTDANVLPTGYARVAGHIADRRIMLAGYRLADLLKRL